MMTADWAMVWITLVYVLATIFICWANFKTARASKEQLEESKKEHDESVRIEIMPFLQFELCDEKEIDYRQKENKKITYEDVAKMYNELRLSPQHTDTTKLKINYDKITNRNFGVKDYTVSTTSSELSEQYSKCYIDN